MPEPRNRVPITPSRSGHIGVVVRALVGAGWAAKQAPANGHLRPNRQFIVLETPDRTISMRMLVYKVTRSNRGREHERRVEITSTYGHGLDPAPGFSDVVLGYDPQAKVLVGLDPIRLRHGGETSNASSFLEAGGLRRSKSAPFVILLRQTRIFPEGEYQAFFRPECLSEYLSNLAAIHSGAYATRGVGGAVSLDARWDEESIGTVEAAKARGDVLILTRDVEPPRRSARLTAAVLRIIDGTTRRRPRQLTPEELRAIQQRQEQNGLLGEQFVFDHEKRVLSEAGHSRLADRVEWVSRRSVGEGYDISSFEPNSGAPLFIEVKSSEQASGSFETSANEWARAKELGEQYCIYRVINVRDVPKIEVLRNPVRLERDGKLRISASGWWVRILSARDGS